MTTPTASNEVTKPEALVWSLIVRVVAHQPHQQGSMTIRYRGKGAHRTAWIAHDDSAALRKWRAAIVTAADNARHATPDTWIPLADATVVDVWLYLERPATVTREYPSVRPDIDKLVRSCLDALTEAGVVTDDAIVCDLNVKKRYADGRPPGAIIRVRPLPSARNAALF